MEPVGEPLVFQGTVDQLEDAADCAVLLRALEDRRANCLFLAIALPPLVLGGLVRLAQGSAPQAAMLAAVAAVIGLVGWRRLTGREALGTVAAHRRIRRRAQARGEYDGQARCRLELSRGELRLYGQDGSLREQLDCRLFHSAVCWGDVVYITGWRTVSVVLPADLLTAGTPEQLRAWLNPYIKKWKTPALPRSWQDRLERLRLGEQSQTAGR